MTSVVATGLRLRVEETAARLSEAGCDEPRSEAEALVSTAAGRPESSGSWGMKGVYASSLISRGNPSSSNLT